LLHKTAAARTAVWNFISGQEDLLENNFDSAALNLYIPLLPSLPAGCPHVSKHMGFPVGQQACQLRILSSVRVINVFRDFIIDAPQNCKYFALSYVQGGVDQLQQTRENFAILSRESLSWNPSKVHSTLLKNLWSSITR